MSSLSKVTRLDTVPETQGSEKQDKFLVVSKSNLGHHHLHCDHPARDRPNYQHPKENQDLNVELHVNLTPSHEDYHHHHQRSKTAENLR